MHNKTSGDAYSSAGSAPGDRSRSGGRRARTGILDDVVDALFDAASRRREELTTRVEEFAGEVFGAAVNLERRQPLVARLLRQGSVRLRALAGEANRRDLREIVRSVGRIAERSPGAFLGGLVCAGAACVYLGGFVSADPRRRRVRAASFEGAPSFERDGGVTEH